MHAMEHTPPNNWRIEGRRSGAPIYDLAARLYPICRSITGDGVRASLEILSHHVPLTVHELATGSQVFDWTIPLEWNIRDAYVKDASGRKVIDFQKSNLHVVNYSTPVRATLALEDLKKHLHTLPEQPDLIPYRTSYYAASWGFCISHNQMLELANGDYDVVIDASLEDGQLTYGEFLHRGEQEDEVLLSAHICHPSLANDNCSGLALLAYIARHLALMQTRYSYRFLFAPGTIGAIAWLSRNEASLDRIRAGLVISCVGDSGGPTYKKSRRGDTLIDRAMMHVLHHMSPARASSNSHPMATTSGSSARPASICRSVCSSAASSARSPSIIRAPTISISYGRSISSCRATFSLRRSISSRRTAYT
jgi:aminopeptidase-like protein